MGSQHFWYIPFTYRIWFMFWYSGRQIKYNLQVFDLVKEKILHHFTFRKIQFLKYVIGSTKKIKYYRYAEGIVDPFTE